MRTAAPALLCLLLGGSASAEGVDKTVAQKNAWAARAKMLEEKVKAVKEACGAEVAASYDKGTFTSFDPLEDRTEAPCRDVLNTLVAVCKTPAGKEGVGKVREVSCRFSTAGTKVKLEGTTLQVWIDPQKTAIEGLKKGSYSWKSALEEIL